MTASSMLVQKTKPSHEFVPTKSSSSRQSSSKQQSCWQAGHAEELEKKLEADAQMRLEADLKSNLTDDLYTCMQADLDAELLDSMENDLLDLCHDEESEEDLDS
mmetsp:Transcript_83810/g.153010  ORF Transcript_83810/g.153010 Transcript_83810/m.153010 type:complete len:104 (+) Transcript_83810:125-436(+)